MRLWKRVPQGRACVTLSVCAPAQEMRTQLCWGLSHKVSGRTGRAGRVYLLELQRSRPSWTCLGHTMDLYGGLTRCFHLNRTRKNRNLSKAWNNMEKIWSLAAGLTLIPSPEWTEILRSADLPPNQKAEVQLYGEMNQNPRPEHPWSLHLDATAGALPSFLRQESNF